VRTDMSDVGNWATTGPALFAFGSVRSLRAQFDETWGRVLEPLLDPRDRKIPARNVKCVIAPKHAGSPPATWPQLTVGGELGPARTAPYTLRWEPSDAERQPNLSGLRSSLGDIATVSRGARLVGKRCTTGITWRLS
jgi:hypothetical protein